MTLKQRFTKLWAELSKEKHARSVNLLNLFFGAAAGFLAAVAAGWNYIFPTPQDRIDIPAVAFWDQENVNVGIQDDCHKDVVHLQSDHNESQKLGGWVTYRIVASAADRYVLDVEYASGESHPARPVQVDLNGQRVSDAAAQGKTTDFCSRHARWEKVATVELKRGVNELKIHTQPGHLFPHLKTFKFLRVEDQP